MRIWPLIRALEPRVGSEPVITPSASNFTAMAAAPSISPPGAGR
jgi:hypothetical protein